MLKALNTAATGMIAMQTRIDVTANNMANVNTTGFRRQRAEFQDLLYQTDRRAGGQTVNGATVPTGIQVGQGTRTVSTTFIHSEGALAQTGGPLDIAIEGQGFFQLTRPDGQIAYTRAGNFKRDDQGQLISVDGFPLEPSVTIPVDATNITISQDGLVSVTTPGQTTSQEIGQIQLALFANPEGLEAIGRSLFMPTNASGEPLLDNPDNQGLGSVSQGYLEGSNVEVVNEMIDLITSQRAYETNQKVIEAADEMLRRITQR
ncbi:MAG: flagellar basal-body rod protein FlgG [Deltaproteobacteria bacterium]|nr:flagellar basal-body rod protein FlgG [Deltaproteobacteria bacterium]